MKLYATVEALLKNEPNYVTDDGDLKKWVIISKAQNCDTELISLLLENPEIKTHFFIPVKDVLIFNQALFIEFMEQKNYLNDSFTAYKNKIGLTIDGKFLNQRNEVALVWPYKDCILEGGQSREEDKREEIFFNEVLAQDEINQLLDPKVLTNAKTFTPDGEKAFEGFTRNEQGTITDNLVIKGNNLLALHSLKEEFAGKVKLIYIDPPYNTGSDSFGYNDNFNHSTWLTFMRNRLVVARDLMRDDGVIFIQCDDNEQAYLKVLMDDIFDKENFLNQVSAKMKQNSGASGGGEDKRLKKNIEYLIIYSKNRFSFNNFNPVYDESDLFDTIQDMKNDGKSWKYTRVIISDLKEREFFKEIKDGSGEIINIFKHSNIIYKTIKELMKEDNLSEAQCYLKYYNKIFRDTNAQSSIRTRVMESTKNQGDFFSIDYIPVSGRNKNQVTTLYYKGNNCDLIAWLSDICVKRKDKLVKLEKLGTFWDGFPLNNLNKEGNVDFSNGKKPEALLQKILNLTTEQEDLILDFHLGSGTTASVAHKMNRQYIGIEQMNYIEEVTVKRLKKVIEGEQGGISKTVNWQGGGSFTYVELKKYNQTFIDKILKAKDSETLFVIWEEMKSKSFLNYNIAIQKQVAHIEDFKKLEFSAQQELLIALLDKNQLYVNLSSLKDKDFECTESELKITKDFYQLKK